MHRFPPDRAFPVLQVSRVVSRPYASCNELRVHTDFFSAVTSLSVAPFLFDAPHSAVDLCAIAAALFVLAAASAWPHVEPDLHKRRPSKTGTEPGTKSSKSDVARLHST